MTGNIIVFCNPAEAYMGMREREVAKAYEQMALQDYDEFVLFGEEYEKWKMVPDFIEVVGEKEKMPLVMQVFYSQDVRRFGGLEGNFDSSSILFNPRNRDVPHRILPDLDIVGIYGENNNLAASEVEKFYKKYGWKTQKFTGKVELIRRKPDVCSRFKFSEVIQIYSPDDLRRIAKEVVGYDIEKLCWRIDGEGR